MTIKQIKGYTILAVQLEPVEGKPKGATHYLFVKKHITKNQPESKTRSLFVVNLPVGASFNSMKRLLNNIALGAHVESFDACEYYDPDDIINYDLDINLSKLSNPDFGEEELPSSRNAPVGCGIVTFLDKDGMNLALSSIKKMVMSSSSSSKLPTWSLLPEGETGSARYLEKSSEGNVRLDSKELAKSVHIAMQDFEKREHEVQEELNTMRQTVDEDGFTVVVGAHRKTKSGVMGSLKTQDDLEHDDRYIKKMKKKEKKDFYRFQIRERKKQEVNDLLRKFKEDQERVRVMREKRKFNPY
ncbi:DEKNAAC101923 [Brettanomyces naardenensis]|uniref:DEKNAAC101923 n=1 Tax=Brettanomyces naardenensis TaxID=13370 RepID=A0A448YJH3_BRENA|nr:DEKNAAC101923 [Brettanomyces naardenensis]